MEPIRALALTVHIIGFGIWIGSLFGIAVALVARDGETDTSVRTKMGALARTYGRPADLGATVAILGGLCLLAAAPAYYLHQPWMHAKLTLVVGVLAIHGFLRMRAKRVTTDAGGPPFPRPLLGVMSLFAVAIIALAVFKPWAH